LITDEAVFKLCDSLKKMPNLEFLTLDFSMCQKLTNCGMSKIFEELALLTKLTKLKVSLNRCNNEVQASFPTLFKNLKNLESIIDLSLDLTGNYVISDQSCGLLDITFFKMKKLQTLHFEFFGCKLSNIALENLGTSMSRLQILENLYLSLGLEEASDLGLQKLSSGLSKMKSLKTLVLTFDWSKIIKGQGLSWLAAGIEKIETLEKFELFFGKLSSLEGDQFKNFGRDLSRNKSVSHCRISFTECQSITDEVFFEFGLSVSKIKTLKFLKIDTNDRISYKIISKLQSSIDDLNNDNLIVEIEKKRFFY